MSSQSRSPIRNTKRNPRKILCLPPPDPNSPGRPVKNSQEEDSPNSRGEKRRPINVSTVLPRKIREFAAICPYDVHQRFIVRSLISPQAPHSRQGNQFHQPAYISNEKTPHDDQFLWPYSHHFVLIPLNSEYVITSRRHATSLNYSNPSVLVNESTCETTADGHVSLEATGESVQSSTYCTTKKVPFGISITRISDVATGGNTDHRGAWTVNSTKSVSLPFPSITGWVRDYSSLALGAIARSLVDALPTAELLLHPPPPPSRRAFSGKTQAESSSFSLSMAAGLEVDFSRDSGDGHDESVKEADPLEQDPDQENTATAQEAFLSAQLKVPHRFLITDAERTHSVWAIEASLESLQTNTTEDDLTVNGVKVISGRDYFTKKGTQEDCVKTPTSNKKEIEHEKSPLVPLIGSGIRGSRDGFFTECRFHTPIALCWKGCEPRLPENEEEAKRSDPSSSADGRGASPPSFSLPFSPGSSLDSQEARACVSVAEYTQLFISDAGNHAIRLADFKSKMVRTIIGQHRIPGYRDGGVQHALIAAATSMAYVSSGLLFTDGPNGALRLLTGRTATISVESMANKKAFPETESKFGTQKPEANDNISVVPSNEATQPPCVDTLLTALDSATRSLHVHKEVGIDEDVKQTSVSTNTKKWKNRKVQQAVHQLEQLLSVPSKTVEATSAPTQEEVKGIDSPQQSSFLASPPFSLHPDDMHMRVWTVAGGGHGNEAHPSSSSLCQATMGYKDNAARSPHCATFGYLTHLSVVPDISGGSDGAIYLCDASHHAIRVLTADGVHTLIGPQDFQRTENMETSGIALNHSWTGLHVPLQVLPISLVRRKAIPPKQGMVKPATVYSTYMALMVSNGKCASKVQSIAEVEESAGGASLLLPVPQSFVNRMESKANSQWSLAELSRKMVQIGSDRATAAGNIPRIIGELSNLSIDLQEDTENVIAGVAPSFSSDSITYYYLDHRRHLRYWFPWVFPPMPAVPAMEHTLHTLYVHIAGQESPRSTSPPSFSTTQGVLRNSPHASFSTKAHVEPHSAILSIVPEAEIVIKPEELEEEENGEPFCNPTLCSQVEKAKTNDEVKKEVVQPERFTPDPVSEPAPLPPTSLKVNTNSSIRGSESRSTNREKGSTSSDRIEPSPLVIRQSSSIKRVHRDRPSVDNQSDDEELERSATGLPQVRSTTASPPQCYTHQELENAAEDNCPLEPNALSSPPRESSSTVDGEEDHRVESHKIVETEESKEGKVVNKVALGSIPNVSTSVVSFSSSVSLVDNTDDLLLTTTKEHHQPENQAEIFDDCEREDYVRSSDNLDNDTKRSDHQAEETVPQKKKVTLPPPPSPPLPHKRNDLQLECADELVLPLPFAALIPPPVRKPSLSVCLPEEELAWHGNAFALDVSCCYPRHVSTFSTSACCEDENASRWCSSLEKGIDGNVDSGACPLQRLFHIYLQFVSTSSSSAPTARNNSERGMSMISLWYFLYCTKYLQAPVALGQCFAKVAEQVSTHCSNNRKSQLGANCQTQNQLMKTHHPNTDLSHCPIVPHLRKQSSQQIPRQLLSLSSGCSFLPDPSVYLQDPRIIIQHLYRSSVRQKGYHVYDALTFKAFSQLLFTLALWEEKALVRIGEKNGEGPQRFRRQQRMMKKLVKNKGRPNFLDFDEDEIDKDSVAHLMETSVEQRNTGWLKIENLFPDYGNSIEDPSMAKFVRMSVGDLTHSKALGLELATKKDSVKDEEDLFQLFSEAALTKPETNEFGEEICDGDYEQEVYEEEVTQRWRHYLSHEGVWTVLQEEVLEDEKSFLQQQKNFLGDGSRGMGLDTIMREGVDRLRRYRGISPMFACESWPFASMESSSSRSNAEMSVAEQEEVKTKRSQYSARHQKEEEAVHCLFQRLLANEKPLWAMFEAFGMKHSNRMPLVELDPSRIRKLNQSDAVSPSDHKVPLLQAIDGNAGITFKEKPPIKGKHEYRNTESPWTTESVAPSYSSFSIVMNWSQFLSLWQSVGIFPHLINHRELLLIFKESVNTPLLVPRRSSKIHHHHHHHKEHLQQQQKCVNEDLTSPSPSTVLHFIPFLESVVRLSLQLFSTESSSSVNKEAGAESSTHNVNNNTSAASKLDLLLRLLQVLIKQNGDTQNLITQLRGSGKLRNIAQQKLFPSAQFSAQPHLRSSVHENVLKMVQNWGKGFDILSSPDT